MPGLYLPHISGRQLWLTRSQRSEQTPGCPSEISSGPISELTLSGKQREQKEKKLYILFPLSSLLGYRHISLCRKLENAISAEQRLCSQQHVVVTWTCGRLKFSFACKAKEAISHRRRWAGETLAKTSGRSRKAQTQSKVSGCKKKKKISRLGAPHISM